MNEARFIKWIRPDGTETTRPASNFELQIIAAVAGKRESPSDADANPSESDETHPDSDSEQTEE